LEEEEEGLEGEVLDENEVETEEEEATFVSEEDDFVELVVSLKPAIRACAKQSESSPSSVSCPLDTL
jgi:hypothetical protein